MSRVASQRRSSLSDIKNGGQPIAVKKGHLNSGKANWNKKLPLDHSAAPSFVDQNDPNYDVDDDDSGVIFDVIIPDLTEEELVKAITPVLQEYLENGDFSDIGLKMEDMPESSAAGVVKQAIMLGMERKSHDRELISVLLSKLTDGYVREVDVRKAFDDLLQVIDDLKVDIPDAVNLLSRFIARAIADDCLAPCFITKHAECGSENAQSVLNSANVLLKMKHGLVRLDNVWGVGGGNRPVKLLVKKIVLALKEFLSSDDTNEADRCIADLEVPHFHHEIVYEAIALALDDMCVNHSEKNATRLARLLAHFYNSGIITVDQMRTGFRRMFQNIGDVALDVPNAHVLLERFVRMSVDAKFLPEDMLDEVPQRSRRRHYSEGGDVRKA
eukprot:Colp12_sorted_trinity150504_noHs@12401